MLQSCGWLGITCYNESARRNAPSFCTTFFHKHNLKISVLFLPSNTADKWEFSVAWITLPRLIMCSTCLNSDMGRDLMTSTYAVKSMPIAMLPRVSCWDDQNVRRISAVRRGLLWTKCLYYYFQATEHRISLKSYSRCKIT